MRALYTPRGLTGYVPIGMVCRTGRYGAATKLMPDHPASSRDRLVAATIDLVRANGYSSTRVEDVCAAAGVTKGSFFHHFESKQDLAIAAARQWGAGAVELFANGAYMAESDPLARLLGYVRFRRELISGAVREWSCYAGTTIQETHETHPAIRSACAGSIEVHLAQLTTMIEQALARYPVPPASGRITGTSSAGRHSGRLRHGESPSGRAGGDRLHRSPLPLCRIAVCPND